MKSSLNFNSQLSTQKGFTLIELLLVIAIVGILSSFVSVNIINVRQKVRDAQRKADLNQLRIALETYRSDIDAYPPAAAGNSLGTCGAALTRGSPAVAYIQKIPCDPTAQAYNNGRYFYSLNGSTYILRACLENTNDKDRTPPPATTTGCSSLTFYEVTNP